MPLSINSVTKPNLGVKELSGTLEKIDQNVEKQLETQTKMFLTYLKNQTIDDKVSTTEMMQGMLTMMMAGQQLKTNKLLSENNDIQNKNFELAKTQYIGQTVVYEHDSLYFNGSPQEINYVLNEDAKKAQIVILDNLGKVVRNDEVSAKAGRNSIIWDGSNHNSEIVPLGDYRVMVKILDANDEEKLTPTYVDLMIDEIGVHNDGRKMPMAKGLLIDLDSPKFLSQKGMIRQLRNNFYPQN